MRCEPALYRRMWPRQRGGGDPRRPVLPRSSLEGHGRGTARLGSRAARCVPAHGAGRRVGWTWCSGRRRETESQDRITRASSAQRGRGLYHRSRTGLACAPHAGAERRRRVESPRRGGTLARSRKATGCVLGWPPEAGRPRSRRREWSSRAPVLAYREYYEGAGCARCRRRSPP
ncbi:hypothetical protein C2845_PM11G26470 [Panicum miliaceum]|uniref:Uncharacterized protein n=1 Tax=Panicum miliaceum TaxID=4540 RepID=A0A3L6RW17_PANMI|nr:hypothetical protein C2845_PM11G26470 [Panicum miliaceum]